MNIPKSKFEPIQALSRAAAGRRGRAGGPRPRRADGLQEPPRRRRLALLRHELPPARGRRGLMFFFLIRS